MQRYIDSLIQNFNDTNAEVPGNGLLPTGVGLATAGITANSIGGITFLGATGFIGTSQFGGAIFLAGLNSVVNVAAVGGVFQFGILVGSAINAIPTGSCGRTIRDSVSDIFQLLLD